MPARRGLDPSDWRLRNPRTAGPSRAIAPAAAFVAVQRFRASMLPVVGVCAPVGPLAEVLA
ncbi:hypothetical protein [Miltoncostaea oceani]|uniref:hypothetical protein n=1 Tax=Miltoncostaea oceani TaxID=2843216 RepID=UPI001C3C9A1B|nr:hypothetical protein [Miltoncostaea oceani]